MIIEEFKELIHPQNKTEDDNQLIIRGKIHLAQEVLIDAGTYAKFLIFDEAKFDKSVKIIGGEFEKLIINERVQNISIEGGAFKSIENQGTIYLFQNISCQNFIHKHNEDVNFKKVDIGTLEVELHDRLTINNNSSIENLIVKRSIGMEIKISDTKLGNITVDNFSKQGRITIKSVFPINRKNKFELINSELKDCKILFSNLSRHKLYLNKSKITSIESNNSKLFRWIFDSENNKPSRDGYRQFKVAMINQYDKINELYFKSKELNAHLSELHWFKNFRTWFVLVTSKVTNNFGFDWFVPMVWIFGLGFIMYFAYQWFIPGNQVFGFGDFLMFINPTHAFDFLVPTEQLTQGAKAIDIITRILIGFFIYQFIAAFRKFAR